MLDRLACHSLAVGLVPIRMADGLLLTGQKAPTSTLRLDDLLYPCPRRVGLESGMVVLLGSPESHRAAAAVLKVFMAYLQANQWEVKIAIFPDKPDYFGYSVCLKSLRVRTKTYYPRRYVVGDTLAISYEDFGIIFSTGLRPEILQGKHPFGAGASQLILICGLHRLATGAGVKLLDDLDFRELVLKGTDFDFPSGDRMGYWRTEWSCGPTTGRGQGSKASGGLTRLCRTSLSSQAGMSRSTSCAGPAAGYWQT